MSMGVAKASPWIVNTPLRVLFFADLMSNVVIWTDKEGKLTDIQGAPSQNRQSHSLKR